MREFFIYSSHMRSKLFFLLFILIFLLSGCTYKESKQTNVVWESEELDMKLYAEGINSSEVHGSIIVDGENIEVFGRFYWSQSSLFLFNEEQLKEDDRNLDYTDAYIEFGIAPRVFSNNSVVLSTDEDEAGYDFLGDIKFTLKCSDIPLEELEAVNFLGMDWYNEETTLYFHNTFHTLVDNKSYGTMEVEDLFVDIEFLYLDNSDFEIRQINNDTLLLSGNYSLEGNNLILTIVDDYYFHDKYESLEFVHLEDYK